MSELLNWLDPQCVDTRTYLVRLYQSRCHFLDHNSSWPHSIPRSALHRTRTPLLSCNFSCCVQFRPQFAALPAESKFLFRRTGKIQSYSFFRRLNYEWKTGAKNGEKSIGEDTKFTITWRYLRCMSSNPLRDTNKHWHQGSLFFIREVWATENSGDGSILNWPKFVDNPWTCYY